MTHIMQAYVEVLTFQAVYASDADRKRSMQQHAVAITKWEWQRSDMPDIVGMMTEEIGEFRDDFEWFDCDKWSSLCELRTMTGVDCGKWPANTGAECDCGECKDMPLSKSGLAALERAKK